MTSLWSHLIMSGICLPKAILMVLLEMIINLQVYISLLQYPLRKHRLLDQKIRFFKRYSFDQAFVMQQG